MSPSVPPVVTALALSADVASPQVVGTTVTWFSTATGGAAPYQYRWGGDDGNGWRGGTEWTTSSTWSWTPTGANGAYLVGVWVRGAGNSTDAPELSTSVPFPIAPLAPLLS